jgi:hypothetical protein
MIALALLTLLTADGDVVVSAPEPWAGEDSRVHFGVGYRAHVGLMESEGTPFLVLQSELLGQLGIRLGDHNELRIQIGFAAGYPDTLAGESNVSFRWALGRHLYIGAGAVAFWGLWSMRAGTELPISIRLGASRQHELTIALRATTGVYNNNTFVWYDFKEQRFAISGEVAVGYAFIFGS